MMTARGIQRPLAAHFLLVPELAGSPPNEAIISALIESGFDVDVYAPTDTGVELSQYGGRAYAKAFPRGWGYRGLLRSVLDPGWRRYRIFGATAEDPLGVAGALSTLHRRPLIALVDEIKTGSYAGDRSRRWKAICQRAVRRADLCIVNDESRRALVVDYAGLRNASDVFVYPGCFRSPPNNVDREGNRRVWGAQSNDLVVAVSGGVNGTSGFDWVLEAAERADAFVLVQPVNLDPFTDFLLRKAVDARKGYVERRRLSWMEAWSSAAACDVGVAIYQNQAPQFQHMGISSNRLCMFLAMGVPVVASKQPSFDFIERYGCGVLVSSADEMASALQRIRLNLESMRQGALAATREYLAAHDRYRDMVDRVRVLARR